MIIRNAIIQHFNYIADFQRLTEALPIRYSTYLTDWRVSFSVLSDHQVPKLASGAIVAKWMAVGAFYDENQMPHVGDRLSNLRLKRNGTVVENTLQIAEILPHFVDDLYILFLTESSTR